MKSWLISGSIVEGKVDFLVTLLYSPFRVFDPFGDNWEYSPLLLWFFVNLSIPENPITHSVNNTLTRDSLKETFSELWKIILTRHGRTSWQTCGYLWDHQSLSADMSRWNVKSTNRWKLFNLTCAKWK